MGPIICQGAVAEIQPDAGPGQLVSQTGALGACSHLYCHHLLGIGPIVVTRHPLRHSSHQVCALVLGQIPKCM